MDSAVASGVSDEGFGIQQSAPKAPRRQRTSHGISRTSIAIALSALIGLVLFALYDIHRTLMETGAKVEMAAMLAASEMAPRQLDAPRATGFAMPAELKGLAQFAIFAADGEVLASTIPALKVGMVAELAIPRAHVGAHAPISGDLGNVLISVPISRVAPQIAWHNGGLLCAVLILTFVFLRRERAPVPPAASPLEAAIDAIPYGLARWSKGGKLIAANPAFRSLLRLEAKQVKRGALYSNVADKLAGNIVTRPVLDEMRQRVIEIEREDGTALLLDERPVEDGGFVTIVTDITERKAADRLLASMREDQRKLADRYHEEKKRAEASSRAKTAFLAHLSHDIRTPLNHIIGFTDLIGMEAYGPLGDERYCTYLGDIRQAGERLLKCFGDVLEFAELEGGRKKLKCEPVDVIDLIQTAASRHAGRAARAGVHLDVRPHASGYLAGDRQCLTRMLDNLLDNAIRFTPRGGEIRLAVWAADDGVVLEVSDTGVGMEEELLSRLSQPFALPDPTYTKTHEGVGLGIAISRAVAEASGGRLLIDSMPDSGTTVAISLPLAEGLPLNTEVARAA